MQGWNGSHSVHRMEVMVPLMKVTRVPGYQPQTTTTTYGVGGVGKGILLNGGPWHGLEHDGEHRKG